MDFEHFDKSTFEDFLREANTKPDYTTNAGSYYKDLARKNHLIELLSKRIWEYDEELAKRFDAWDKNLEDFDQSVIDLLNEWIDDGTFAHIINEEIFQSKTDTVDFEKLVARVNNTASYVVAKNFTGTTGGEKIQRALDSIAPFSTPHKVVVVDSEGMDDDNVWLLNSPLKIPSDTTLLLNGSYLKLASGVNNHILENADYNNGNENIHVIGVGNVVLDCNRENQVQAGMLAYQTLGVLFSNVTNFSIKGITIKDPIKQCLGLEKCVDGTVKDIVFDTQGHVNQDGVHIIGPSSDIIVSGIRGVLGDDALVVNARTSPPQGYGDGGDVSNITFNDVIVRGGTSSDGGAFMGLFRAAPGVNYKIKNITLSNATGLNVREGLLRLGGNEVAPIDHLENIIVNNVYAEQGTSGAVHLVKLMTSVRGLQINNAKTKSENTTLIYNDRHSIENMQMNNIQREVIPVLNELEFDYVFQFRGGTHKGIQISNFNDLQHSNVLTTYLFDFRDSHIEDFYVDNIQAPNVRSYIDTANHLLIDSVRLSDVKLNDNGDASFSGFTSTDDIVINGYSIETGDGISTIPTRKNYQIGDTVLYRQSISDSWKTYQRDHVGSWRRVDSEKNMGIRITIPTNVTINGNSFFSVEVGVPSSSNSVFYDLKPSFILPSSVVYSYQNYDAGKIRVTLMNGSSNPVTITGTAWLAVGTTATFS